jgi:hypothetical protein
MQANLPFRNVADTFVISGSRPLPQSMYQSGRTCVSVWRPNVSSDLQIVRITRPKRLQPLPGRATAQERAQPYQADVRVGSMLSKKYQTASRLISRRKTNHAMIVRRYAPRLVTKVTGEFIALRCLPPHIYKIAAPTARRICVQRCKKTFSTASVKVGSRPA